MPPNLDCYFSSGDKLACALDQLSAAVGGTGMLGLGIGVLIVFPLWYVSDGHPGPPTVATVLLSGMLLPMVPPGYRSLVTTILIVGGVSGLLAFARAYVFNPGAGGGFT